ncbi:MAG: tetratricopeptide repeat protein [Candidatus Eisenbacteria bacterium]|nr:tetratricopeptide repeat protein [Candidatus Eisenbacteria bacterium]
MLADGTRFASGAGLIAASLIAALVWTAALPAGADDGPAEPEEAIERARTLEREGHPDDAFAYLQDLVHGDEGLARDARVLLELSRLAPSADASVEFLQGAADLARDDEIAARARAQLGDYMYARGSYMEAAEQYRAAAERSEGAATSALLNRAASLLAAGDATAAAEVYRELRDAGETPGETTPWAILGLGRALLVKGDLEEAAGEFERLAETYVDHDARPGALAGAAEARIALGDVEAARRWLELLLAEYPGTYESVLAREDLRSLPPDSTRLEGPSGHAGPVPAAGPADPGAE